MVLDVMTSCTRRIDAPELPASGDVFHPKPILLVVRFTVSRE